ncbi:MAG: U32 family peptidase, partial [Bacteroidaceae bacterium]|nr:U32 family peptidase [Bacteroidaceae bacterium]
RCGFERVVVAREMPLADIKRLHKKLPQLELECFVHGALCISYSGACYASEHCFSRSANRGECAQFCRLPFDLVDADGKTIIYSKHLLSLKDMCRIDSLEELVEAGVCSFKIEGRLKESDYVKNVVAAYSQRLDKLCKASDGRYKRASKGRVEYAFPPDLRRTFNRGYTEYFLHGRKPNIENLITPKSVGMPVGKVKDRAKYWFSVSTSESFANGDGLCFIDEKKRMHGFRINKVEGNKLVPQTMPEDLKKGTMLFRNHDEAFTKLLQGKTAERKIDIVMRLEVSAQKLSLIIVAAQGKSSINSHSRATTFTPETPFEQAAKPQEDNIKRNLAKLGNTPFVCNDIEIVWQDAVEYFIPASVITKLRQSAISEKLEIIESRPVNLSKQKTAQTLDVETIQQLAETAEKQAKERIANGPLMECRHCIRYALGYCPKETTERAPWQEPLSLKMSDGRVFPLQFDCKHCQMNVLKP